MLPHFPHPPPWASKILGTQEIPVHIWTVNKWVIANNNKMLIISKPEGRVNEGGIRNKFLAVLQVWSCGSGHCPTPALLSPVFSQCSPEPRGPGSQAVGQTLWISLGCPADRLWTDGQAPRNRAWQTTQGRSLNLALAPVRWGWKAWKASLCTHHYFLTDWGI